MKIGKLPNYKKYLTKLNKYSKLCGVRVEMWYNLKEVESEDNEDFVDTDMGEWILPARKINLSKNSTNKELIASYLHELGHFVFDFVHAYNKELDKAYSILNNDGPLTRKQKNLIYKCEAGAWKYGRVLAKKLNIKLGRWFDIEEEKALEHYRVIKTKNKKRS